MKTTLMCRYLFSIINRVFFCLLFYARKNVKLLKNSEYLKSQKAKTLSVLRPDLSFSYKKLCTLINCLKIINFRELYRPSVVKNEDI